MRRTHRSACAASASPTATERTGLRRSAGVSLDVAKGEVFGLVGESGCGKSTLALTLLGYRYPGAKSRARGLGGGSRSTRSSPERPRRASRRRISFVPQNPTTALNPARRIGDLVVEVLMSHGPRLRGRRRDGAVAELLIQVGLPEPDAMMKRYPHQLSGGTAAARMHCDGARL